jgi:phosphate transport system permease protein
MMRSFAWRQRRDRMMTILMVASLLLALIPLALILVYVVIKGAPHLSLGFFTQPVPFSPIAGGGGYGAAIRGTIKVVALATVIAVPIGVFSAVYLVEYGQRRPFALVVEFLTDVMTGVPSIFVGIFIYSAIVLLTKSFSTWAGAVALAVLMLPLIARSSEIVLRLVPDDLREAGLALGIGRARIITRIVLPAALPGITTGVLLAVARAAGETAPLLLTAFGNQLIVPWSTWNGPESTLTYQIFQDSRSPFATQQARAWTGALVLVAGILVLTVAARTFANRKQKASR